MSDRADVVKVRVDIETIYIGNESDGEQSIGFV